jgi:hypothetical protein
MAARGAGGLRGVGGRGARFADGKMATVADGKETDEVGESECEVEG